MNENSSYKDVLAIHSFRSLWLGQVCSQLAVNTLLFVLALRLYQTTGSNTAVSGLFLAYGIPAMLFGMVAGTAVDHLDKRRVLIYCDIIRAIFVLTLFFLSDKLFIVYLVTLVNAVITQFYVPAEAPTIPRLVPPQHIVSANSLFSFTFYGSLALGSVAAGPLFRLFGHQWIFPFLASFFVLAARFESRIPPMGVGVLGFRTVLSFEISHIVSRIWCKLTDGLTYVRRSRVLFDSLLLLTGTQIIFVMLGTLGPGFADRVLAIDIRDASLLIVGPAVLGILIGTIWVGNFGSRFRSRNLINVGVTAAGITLLLISVIVRMNGFSSQRLALMVLLFFLLGFANSLLDVPANSLLQEEAKGSMRGRVYGMLTAAIGGVGILPVFAGGILADVVGVGKVVFLLGLVILLYGIFRIKYNHT